MSFRLLQSRDACRTPSGLATCPPCPSLPCAARGQRPCLRRSAEASSDALTPLRRAEGDSVVIREESVSYTHLRAHETVLDLVCRLLLEKKKKKNQKKHITKLI